jgi:hypothetical protein
VDHSFLASGNSGGFDIFGRRRDGVARSGNGRMAMDSARTVSSYLERFPGAARIRIV